MSSTNLGSILIFASCVVGTCNIQYYVGEFLLLKKQTHIYTSIYIFYKKHFKDVSREFDEFDYLYAIKTSTSTSI